MVLDLVLGWVLLVQCTPDKLTLKGPIKFGRIKRKSN